MPSDKQTRKQRHQTQVKTQRGKAIRGAESVEFVKNSGFRKSEFIGGKKYYTPMSTDPTSSGAGGDVTNVTISGGSSPSNDERGVYSLQTILPIQGGHVSPIVDTGQISIVEYDPIGAAAEGAVDTSAGVVSSKGETYNLNNPGTFNTHFLRKDGTWADVSASLDSFKTWRWIPTGVNAPFNTVADSSADMITVTAAGGLQFTDTSTGTTDSLTMTVPIGTDSVLGVVKVAGGNKITEVYSSGTVTLNHDTTNISDSDNSGTTFIQDLTFDSYGHVSGRVSSAIPVYMPSGPEGGVDTGVISTDDTYDTNYPSANNFQDHYLRKDGTWYSPTNNIVAFKTLSWTPSGGGTPFATVADAIADSLTLTAGSGMQVALTSADHVTLSTTHTVGDGGLTQKNFTTTLKNKLDNIEDYANDYSHPTGDGNKHLPSGGSAEQYLKHNGSGTGQWAGLPFTGAANTLSDTTTLPTSTGRVGVFKEISTNELKFYALKAGNNITLDKNNDTNEADTYIEISAAGTTVSNANWTGVPLEIGNGGTGVTSVSDLKSIVLGLGSAAYTSSDDYADDVHSHNYIATSHAANSITSSHITVLGNTSNTNSGDITFAGTPDYITISGQVITRGLINLTTDVTGNLPDGNIASSGTWDDKLDAVMTTAGSTGSVELVADSGTTDQTANIKTLKAGDNVTFDITTHADEIKINAAAPTHDHDGRYYIKTEMDTKLALKADSVSLGDLATQDTVNNDDWSGTDLSITNGGTGASSASAARNNLELGTAAQSSSTDFVSATGDDIMLGTLTIGSSGTNKYYNRINNSSNWLIKTERSDATNLTGIHVNGFKDMVLKSNNADVLKLRDDGVTVYKDMLPSGNKTLDLGSATKYFDNIYSEGYRTTAGTTNYTGETPTVTLRVYDAPSSGSGFGSTKYDLVFVNGLLVNVTPVLA